MVDRGFVIRRMTLEDVELAVEWAAEEGWNPGIDDAACFFHADPDGFFIGEVEGRPVGCISAVSYGESFGFIGFYIVRKELRGKWYSVELGRRAMSRLGTRNIGIDGVVAKIGNYEKFGFTLAHRNIRYESRGRGASNPAGIIDLATFPFDAVVSYDSGIFPARRSRFLERWIIRPDGAALGFAESGEIKGYGVIRPCRTGFKTGPLFADSPEIAGSLFDALTGNVPERAPVFLDIPANNPAAVAFVRDHGMTPVFETGRMYNGQAPAVPIEKVFGITSFELG